MQDQSYANARTLNREFWWANRALQGSELGELIGRELEAKVFAQVDEVAKMMAADPSLTVRSPVIRARLAALEVAIKEITGRRDLRGRRDIRKTAQRAGQVTQLA